MKEIQNYGYIVTQDVNNCSKKKVSRKIIMKHSYDDFRQWMSES